MKSQFCRFTQLPDKETYLSKLTEKSTFLDMMEVMRFSAALPKGLL